MEYKIEKGIPLPKNTRGRKLKYPFAEMEVGDSFDCGEYKYNKAGSVSTSARTWAMKNKKEWKFRVAKTEYNTLRIWRYE